jgi:hypothetical protein
VEINTNARSARHNGKIIDGYRSSPTALTLLILLLGMVLELYGTRAKVRDGTVGRRAAV